MKRAKVPYEVSSGLLLLTRCKLRGMLVGSIHCMKCPSYESKNMKEHYVVCNNRTLQERRQKTETASEIKSNK